MGHGRMPPERPGRACACIFYSSSVRSPPNVPVFGWGVGCVIAIVALDDTRRLEGEGARCGPGVVFVFHWALGFITADKGRDGRMRWF